MLVKYVYWYVFACVCTYLLSLTVKWWGCTVWLTCVSVMLSGFSLCRAEFARNGSKTAAVRQHGALGTKASHQKYNAKTGGSTPAGPDCGTLNSPGWVTSNHLLQMKNTLLLTWICLQKSSTNTKFIQFGRRQHKKKKKLQLLLLLKRIVMFPQ